MRRYPAPAAVQKRLTAAQAGLACRSGASAAAKARAACGWGVATRAQRRGRGEPQRTASGKLPAEAQTPPRTPARALARTTALACSGAGAWPLNTVPGAEAARRNARGAWRCSRLSDRASRPACMAANSTGAALFAVLGRPDRHNARHRQSAALRPHGVTRVDAVGAWPPDTALERRTAAHLARAKQRERRFRQRAGCRSASRGAMQRLETYYHPGVVFTHLAIKARSSTRGRLALLRRRNAALEPQATQRCWRSATCAVARADARHRGVRRWRC